MSQELNTCPDAASRPTPPSAETERANMISKEIKQLEDYLCPKDMLGLKKKIKQN